MKTISQTIRILLAATLFLFSDFAGVIPAMAQNKTLYVYRNDGDFNAFLTEDIDSIIYSTVDDSLTYDQVAVQEIWTKNGVTRIPVDAIDSVSFKTPEPVFRENVFHLTRDVLSYVTYATQTELTFKSSTPASKRPVQGQVVISDYLDEPVTGGFAGKVTSVTRNGSDWVVTCGYVSFDEIFERVALVGKSVLCDENSSAAKQFAPKRSNNQDLKWWELADFGDTFVINNLGTFSLDIGKHVTLKDKDPIFVCTYSFYANAGYYKLSADVESLHEITAEFKFEAKGKDELKNLKKPSISELVSKQADFDLLKNMAGITEPSLKDRLLNGGPVWFIPICPAVIAGIRLFPYIELNGSIYAQVELPITLTTSHGFTAYGLTGNPLMAVFTPHEQSSSNLASYVSPELGAKLKKPGTYLDVRFAEAQGTVGVKGSVDAGVGLTLFFKAGGALLQGSVTAKAGFSLSGDANLSTDVLVGDQSYFNGSMWNWYRGLADSKISLDGQIKIEPKLEVLKVDLISLAKEKFWDDLPEFKWKSKPWNIFTAYLFPEYTAPEVMHSDQTTTTGIQMKSTVSRNIIIPGDVGMRVYNQFGGIEKEDYHGQYFLEMKDHPYTMTMDISDLPQGQTYTICPMFKWGENFRICAWPPTEFKMPLPLSMDAPELIVAVGETLRTDIVGGWGDYTVKSNDETIATCVVKKETKNGKDYYYVDVTGKKRDETDIILTDKVSREQFTQHVIVTPKDQGSGNIGDMPGIEL